MEEQLYCACREGKVEEVQNLLQNSQIDINWQNHSNYLTTPFYVACEKGRIDIVKLLLNDNRVDINKANIRGQTPFFIACYIGHKEVVNVLRNDSNNSFFHSFFFF